MNVCVSEALYLRNYLADCTISVFRAREVLVIVRFSGKFKMMANSNFKYDIIQVCIYTGRSG